MRIGICDDELTYRETIEKLCKKFLSERNMIAEIIEFSSGEQLLSYKKAIDILFLDIQMGGMNGIVVKEQLDLRLVDTIIIYVSGYMDFMQDAFGKHVYSFLLKPIQEEKFYSSLDRVIKEIQSEFIVKIDNKNVPYIKGNTIMYIQAADKYTNVVAEQNDYLIRKSMNEWEQILEEHDFYRIHKSYLINFAYIKEIKKEVVMNNGSKIKVSQKREKEFKEKYYSFLRRKASFD